MRYKYTTQNRPTIQVRWRNLIVDLLTPLIMVLFAATLWSKGLPVLGVFGLTVAWIYVLVRVWRVSGARNSFQIHAFFSGIAFLGMGAWLVFTGKQHTEGTSYIIGGLVFLLVFVVMDIGERVKKLESPSAKLITATTGRRTEDFPGVYRITCIPNGMVYIGMTSRPIKERWQEHTRNLDAGRHHNDRMQHDWRIYRPEQFTWEVLEVVTDQAWLFDRERYWQDIGYTTAARYNPPNTPRIIHSHGKRPKPKR